MINTVWFQTILYVVAVITFASLAYVARRCCMQQQVSIDQQPLTHGGIPVPIGSNSPDLRNQEEQKRRSRSLSNC